MRSIEFDPGAFDDLAWWAELAPAERCEALESDPRSIDWFSRFGRTKFAFSPVASLLGLAFDSAQ